MVLSTGFAVSIQIDPSHLKCLQFDGGETEKRGLGMKGGKRPKDPLRFQGLEKFCQVLLFRGSTLLDLLGLPLQRTGHVPGLGLGWPKKAPRTEQKLPNNLST